jgi:ATP-dependent Lhr-like helicase
VSQIDAPTTVASFLQRLGRTGRRPGTSRNTLVLARSTPSLLQAAALLLLGGRGWVEPVAPPPEPPAHRRPADPPGYLDRDSGVLFIGPEAELRFGRRHFTGMTSAFSTSPEFTVLAGRTELGRIDPALLTEASPRPRLLLLGGRS